MATSRSETDDCAELKAGFFDKPRSTQAVRERLTEKGVACSSGLLRVSVRKRLKKAGLGLTEGEEASSTARKP